MKNIQIIKLYTEIFDKNGEIKPCGRDKCKKLIMLLSEAEPSIDFGNAETGFMNVDNIRNYIELK